MHRAGEANIPRRRTVYQAVLTSNFDDETLQHILVSRQGHPCTPVMDNVMDWMDTWGRLKSNLWYEEAVEMLAFYCDEKIKDNDKEIIQEIIALKVKDDIRLALSTTALLGWTTYNEWTEWFDYQYDFVTRDFFELASKTQYFVSDKIEDLLAAVHEQQEELHQQQQGQVETPATPTQVVSSSALVSP